MGGRSSDPQIPGLLVVALEKRPAGAQQIRP
jgi:hypothetical protein